MRKISFLLCLALCLSACSAEEEKPEEEKRAELCRAAFHWSGKEGCWQRLLTQNAVQAAKSLVFLKGE